MKTKNNLTKRLSIWAGIVAAILMIPLIGQFPWSKGDFIFAGVVLFGSAVGYEVAANRLTNKMYRMTAAVVAIGVVMFIWFLAVSGP